METNLAYLGSSAIEDKLQEGVPETIAKLIETKIRVWVLTGDKQETAIEIGKSCKLIQNDMNQIIMTSKTEKEFTDKLQAEVKKIGINMAHSATQINEKIKEESASGPKRQRICMVIDGPTLSFALENHEVSHEFFKLCLYASSVICCRVTPKQKADVV